MLRLRSYYGKQYYMCQISVSTHGPAGRHHPGNARRTSGRHYLRRRFHVPGAHYG